MPTARKLLQGKLHDVEMSIRGTRPPCKTATARPCC